MKRYPVVEDFCTTFHIALDDTTELLRLINWQPDATAVQALTVVDSCLSPQMDLSRCVLCVLVLCVLCVCVCVRVCVLCVCFVCFVCFVRALCVARVACAAAFVVCNFTRVSVCNIWTLQLLSLSVG